MTPAAVAVETTQIPVLFRGTSAEHASELARAWAAEEGLDARGAGTRRRFDLPTWGTDGDPYTDLYAFEVMVVVAGDTDRVRLPEVTR